jgi:RNA polymerase sigma-70 factor (ECF subfamily)
MEPADAKSAAEIFEQHRPKLTGLAYRLLGRMGEAEEVAQDAFLRWFAADREEVRDPYAFLVTTVTRLSLDRLKSARARHEQYVGSWLPEPVMTDRTPVGPLDSLEQRDLISIGLMRLLERLSAPERAVFVLREAFDLSYEEIAATLGLELAHCRQLHSRAQKRLSSERSRFTPSREEHLRLLTELHSASQRGDVDGLRALLTDGVVSYGDGGGRVRTAINPVQGADRVARLFVGLARKYPEEFARVQTLDVNGTPGLMISFGGIRHVLCVDIEDGRIRNIYNVANPEKLAYLERQLAEDES